MQGKIYQFEDYLLDVSQQRLQKNGEAVSLPPKVFEVLIALIKRHGQLVTYQELMEEVWQDVFVEETNLRYSIHALRKTFPENFIETIPKRGYRFKPEVESFTVEEFIGKHTGKFKKAEPENQTSDENKPSSVFKKYAAFSIVALLVTGVVFFGFYFWQNGKVKSADSKHFKTIAVLPFTVIGEKPENISEIQHGLADAMVFNLDKIRGLKVTPTKDIQNLFGKDFEALEIGRNLGADEVLTGTYRLENNLARVDVSLLRASDGATVWTKTLTVKEQNQIESENSIVLPIARQIELEIARLADAQRIKNLDLSDELKQNYLTAREILRMHDFGRQREAVGLFEKILAQKSDWALANAGYAESLVLSHGGEKGCQQAQNFARKAIELDGSIAEPHLALGFCHWFNWDWKNAEQAFQKAIQINPENARAYHEYGVMLDLQRRFAEAETNFKKAIELEPFSPYFRSSLCQHYYYDKRFNDALAQCYQSEKINPAFWRTLKILQWIYTAQGRYDEIFKFNYGNLTKAEIAQNSLAKTLSEGNVKKYWELSLKERLNNPQKGYSPYAVAGFYARLGDQEKTLEWLEKASESPTYDLSAANADPLFDVVRNDARFKELMKKINLNP